MATANIAGRYVLYKEGTAKVVRWLATTARVSNRSVVRTNELLTFASAAVAAKPAIEIPSSILEVLQDVILGRQVCAEWYAGQDAPDLAGSASDRSHCYFIEVLRKVYRILNEARKQQRAQRTIADASPTGQSQRIPEEQAKESLSNLFEQLELEETSQDVSLEEEDEEEIIMSAPASVRKEAPVSGAMKVDVELHADEERRFAFWCFMEDLHDLHKSVLDAWDDYSKGKLSLLAACSVTDTAFGIMRRASDALAQDQADFTDYDKAMQMLGLTLVDLGNDDEPMKPSVTHRNCRPLDPSSPALELLCPQAGALLGASKANWASWAESAERHQTPCKKETTSDAQLEAPSTPAMHETSSHATEEDSSTARFWRRLSFNPFAAELIRLIAEIRACDTMGHSHSRCYDEFVRGLVSVSRNMSIPTWLVVACQTYMDFYGILSSGSEVAFHEWRSATLRSKASEKLYLKAQNGRKPALIDARVVANLQHCVAHADLVTGQLCLVDRVRGATFSEGTSVAADDGLTDWLPSGVYLGLPLSAGDCLYHLKLTLHTIGVRIANDYSAVLAMAHIYRAMMTYGLLEFEWADMEWFIKQHGHGHLLLPEIGTPIDCGVLARCYEIAMGMPASATVPGSKVRQVPLKTIANNRRRIYSGSRFVRNMEARTTEELKLGFSRGETIDVVLRQMHEEASKDQRRGRHGQHPAITGKQLLGTYQRIITSDEPELNFDYLAFYARCITFFDATKQAVSHRLPTNGIEIPQEPPELGLVLLYETSLHLSCGASVQDSILGDAAKILQLTIRTNGDELMKIAYQQSSGHIPKDLHPAFNSPCADLLSNIAKEQVTSEQADATQNKATVSPDEAAQEQVQTLGTGQLSTVQEAFAAQKKKRGRRLLRTRK